MKFSLAGKFCINILVLILQKVGLYNGAYHRTIRVIVS